MSTPTTTKPRNGKGKAIKCPNAPECEVALAAADSLALIDARLVHLMESTQRVHDEALDFRRAVLESHDRVLEALHRVESKVEGMK